MDRLNFKLGNRLVGAKAPCLIIGEVAQAHDGSLGMAHAYIDAIADAGADAVKFQTHIAATESSSEESWRIQFSYQDKSRYDYWERMGFTAEQWWKLKKHAEERGLIFLSSPFSEAAVDLLSSLGIEAWKVASGELSNELLINKVLQTHCPVLISSGMSDIRELDKVTGMCKESGVEYAILQCTSCYPCPPEKIGINMLPFLQERYHCPIGLSDHSGTIFAGLAAATLGSNILEIHVTLSRKMFGPDVSSSITDVEMSQLITGIRFIEEMINNPVDKQQMAEELISVRKTFTRSVALKNDLSAGAVIQEEDLTLKKPGTGIPPCELQNLIGKRLLKNISAKNLLRYEDVDNE
ncbi:MAG: N-acetylneuraminate synthase family protein [Phycisphaerales bacterium]